MPEAEAKPRWKPAITWAVIFFMLIAAPALAGREKQKPDNPGGDNCHKTKTCDTPSPTPTPTPAPAPDAQPPTAAIDAPSDNAKVSGTVKVTGTASDNVAVAAVEVAVGGSGFTDANGTSVWALPIDTTTLSDGTHTVTARATDPAGNRSAVSITIDVANASTDTGGGSGGTSTGGARTAPFVGLWPGSPDRTIFTAQRKDLGLDGVWLTYRERGGRGGLADPLIKIDTLPANTKIAVEVDPRWSGSQQSQYPGAAFMATQTEAIVKLAKEAAARADEIAYVEIDSEADLDTHAPPGETLAERQAGFIAFTKAVCKQFRIYAPSLPLVPSFTRTVWMSTSHGQPEQWLTPEVLDMIDGIGVDGYSRAYTTEAHSPDLLFAKAIAWNTAHGKPTYLTEYGVEEHNGDAGEGKAAEFDAMLTFAKHQASTDGGKTGLVHLMLNTSTDGPADDAHDWLYTTTLASRLGFIRLTKGLSG